MNRPRRTTASLVALTALALTACSAGTAASRDPFGGPAAARASELVIVTENRFISEVTLFAVSSGRRVRMGYVGGMNDKTFSIPWASQANLQVEIQPLDGSRYLTPAIIANPGEEVLLVVESQLRYSRLRH